MQSPFFFSERDVKSVKVWTCTCCPGREWRAIFNGRRARRINSIWSQQVKQLTWSSFLSSDRNEMFEKINFMSAFFSPTVSSIFTSNAPLNVARFHKYFEIFKLIAGRIRDVSIFAAAISDFLPTIWRGPQPAAVHFRVKMQQIPKCDFLKVQTSEGFEALGCKDNLHGSDCKNWKFGRLSYSSWFAAASDIALSAHTVRREGEQARRELWKPFSIYSINCSRKNLN